MDKNVISTLYLAFRRNRKSSRITTLKEKTRHSFLKNSVTCRRTHIFIEFSSVLHHIRDKTWHLAELLHHIPCRILTRIEKFPC